MAEPVLYFHDISPPCRAALLAAEVIGVPVKIKEVNLQKQENLSPEFVKINPQHTIPTLDDNGFVLVDSHAIMTYLADKYGKNDALYPKDVQKRAVVDQYLFFDVGMLFSLAKSMFRPIIFLGAKEFSEEQVKTVRDGYDILNKSLEGKKFLAGDAYTLADISCVASVLALTLVSPLDDFPNLKAWKERCEKEIPHFAKVHDPGHTKLVALLKSKMNA